MNLTSLVKRIFWFGFSFVVFWLGVYLGGDLFKVVFSFESHLVQTEATVDRVELDETCFQPSGGKLTTCSDILKVEYSFFDASGGVQSAFEVVDFWFTSEAFYAQHLENAAPLVSYDAQNPAQSTLFLMRRRLYWAGGFLISVVFMGLGGLGVYQAVGSKKFLC